MVLGISGILSCEEDVLIVNGTEPWRLTLSEVAVVKSTQIGRFFSILETTDGRKYERTFARADIAEGNRVKQTIQEAIEARQGYPTEMNGQKNQNKTKNCKHDV
jgi:hypothetical protein